MTLNIIEKIEKNGLLGRGGASFPVAFKWRSVREAESESKYIICNAAEGEPGVFKDDYILDNHPDKVIDGVKLAIDILNADKAYIYINKHYYNDFHEKLLKKFAGHPIDFFIKPKNSGYIGGEETSILNIIEGGRAEPRLRPPFPPTRGLWGYPTLIHNVETFYDISLVASGQFENKRFYSITGDCSRPGTYDLSADFTIERILKRTGNWPDHHFFAQVGGDAGGEVLNDRQLKKKAIGAGSITVYRADSYKPKNIIGDWIDFFLNQSCGKCTPCREGVYRIKEIFDSTKPDWRLFYELVNNLDATSFCGLGRAASIPITSYLRNVLAKGYVKQTDLSDKEIKEIKQCFS